MRLVPMMRQFNSALISIVGNMSSPLAQEVDVALNGCVEREADPLGLVPTASTIVALALGDALAAALMQARGFGEQDFLRFHPGGLLGRSLLLRVADVMHRGKEVAWVAPETSLREVVIAMTEKPLGAACVVDGEQRLLGLITDGDVRRALRTHEDFRFLSARDVMTRQPTVVFPESVLREAARLMEDRPSQISVLPVVEAGSRHCLGLIRLHDIYRGEVYP